MSDTEQPNSQGEDKQPQEVKLPYPYPPFSKAQSISINGETLHYEVTMGTLALKNADTQETEAHIFFTAYTLPQEEGSRPRPLTFSFNGGPGSSSVWLHLGALGPKRVQMQDDGTMPAAPYQLVDNPATWLPHSDLVFIDPVGTGYSRAVKKDLNKNYWNLQGDLDSVGDFIRLYLSQYQRWDSPLFMVGESYGTTRAAGLAGELVSKGIAFNGVMLISTVLNFQTLDFEIGNDLPYLLFLPSYTATAWYHQQLPQELQQRPLRDVLAEVEAWVESDYVVALMRGDALPPEQYDQIQQQLARYTGLSERFVDHSDLRVNIFLFCKELLREQNLTVGRLDSRLTGMDRLPVTMTPDFDPSLVAITPPYTAMMNHYARSLGFQVDLTYEVLSFAVNQAWEWERGLYPDTSERLRSAFAKNPHMKLFVAQGYYDLATPYYAARYTLNHMRLDRRLRDNVREAFYEAGHMFYIDVNELQKLGEEAADFIRFALA